MRVDSAGEKEKINRKLEKITELENEEKEINLRRVNGLLAGKSDREKLERIKYYRMENNLAIWDKHRLLDLKKKVIFGHPIWALEEIEEIDGKAKKLWEGYRQFRDYWSILWRIIKKNLIGKDFNKLYKKYVDDKVNAFPKGIERLKKEYRKSLTTTKFRDDYCFGSILFRDGSFIDNSDNVGTRKVILTKEERMENERISNFEYGQLRNYSFKSPKFKGSFHVNENLEYEYPKHLQTVLEERFEDLPGDNPVSNF